MLYGRSLLFRAVVPNRFGTGDQFCGRQFFYKQGGSDGFRMIHAHHIHCALDIWSNAAADLTGSPGPHPEGWGP